MRFKQLVTVICDGCGEEAADVVRETVEVGQGMAARAKLPTGWGQAPVVPSLVVGHSFADRLMGGQPHPRAQVQLDPFQSIDEVVRVVGPMVGTFCSKCLPARKGGAVSDASP